MNTETSEHVVRSFFAHLAAGEVDALLAQMADDAAVSVLGEPEKFPLAGIKTKAQFGALLTELCGAVLPHRLQISLEEMTVEGDRVVVEVEFDVAMATGQVYREYHRLFLEIREGKIQAVQGYATARAWGVSRWGSTTTNELSLRNTCSQ